MALIGKSTEEDEVRVNLTPMIDVVFLLIIFFMVATKFHELEREIDVRLPKTSDAKPLTNPPQEIIINVKRDGTIVVRGRTLSLTELRRLLAEARESYPDQVVLVRGDEKVYYGRIARVLGVCKGAGIENSNLAVLQEGP